MTFATVLQPASRHKHMFEEPLASNTRSCLADTVANTRSPREVSVSALAYRLPHRSFHPPYLRLVPPPAVQRAPSHVYRRRRIVAAAFACAALWVVASVVSSAAEWAWARSMGESQVATVATQSVQSAGAPLKEWTVRPGDTLWGIARSMQPQGDFRPVLDELTARYQNRPLQIGETIVLP